MCTAHAHHPLSTPPGASSHRGRHHLLLLLALGGGLGLMLYLHGVTWWYGPLAVAGLIAGHVAVFGLFVALTTWVLRGKHASRGAGHHEHGAGHDHAETGMVLHGARMYDLLVRAITLGGERRLRRWMLDLADLRPGQAVLDVGAGTGSLLLAAAERVGPAGALRGLEPSEEMRARALGKARKRGVALEVTAGLADNMPYPPASFDAVFCTLVLHHIPASRRDAALREMGRVLRPGGRLVIVDWQRPESSWAALTDGLALAFLMHYPRSGTLPGDLLALDPLLTELGFTGITRQAYGSGVLCAVAGRLAPAPPETLRSGETRGAPQTDSGH